MTKCHYVLRSYVVTLIVFYNCLHLPFRRGAVVSWLGIRTHNTGIIGLNPPRVTMKTPLVRKATGNHLMNSTSLEKNSEPCIWFLACSKLSMLCSQFYKIHSLERTQSPGSGFC